MRLDPSRVLRNSQLSHRRADRDLYMSSHHRNRAYCDRAPSPDAPYFHSTDLYMSSPQGNRAYCDRAVSPDAPYFHSTDLYMSSPQGNRAYCFAPLRWPGIFFWRRKFSAGTKRERERERENGDSQCYYCKVPSTSYIVNVKNEDQDSSPLRSTPSPPALPPSLPPHHSHHTQTNHHHYPVDHHRGRRRHCHRHTMSPPQLPQPAAVPAAVASMAAAGSQIGPARLQVVCAAPVPYRTRINLLQVKSTLTKTTMEA